ncbi:helix-turn-helix domain-containing protein [Mannheimia pernigra]|uniref:helix-turn-helix domain-containing protein n=1 Tax=Mannheimia pernigra TaxID=111844 RepID=UPI001CEF7CD0|nr:helix-turn-helix transcriptional regulator [Mannheimia pernigra]
MIGERLKLARSAAGLSMQALVSAVGISANMIKKYEHNLNMPTSSMLLKLSQVLNTRIEFFFEQCLLH